MRIHFAILKNKHQSICISLRQEFVELACVDRPNNFYVAAFAVEITLFAVLPLINASNLTVHRKLAKTNAPLFNSFWVCL